jgi:hypothetical protein
VRPGRSKFLVLTVPAFLIAAVVVTAGIEVWVRAAWNPKNGEPGLFLSDAYRGQRLAPNYDGWFAGVPVHINNLGFRDPRDYSLEKHSNTFRIIFLGDSVTFGHGSLYEHSYPYLVEQKLKAWRPDVDWQVWNLAVPGYNTSQELQHLKEIGPRFAPDLVIVGFYENDLVDNQDPRDPGVLRLAAARALSFAERHVYSIQLYKRVFLQLAWRMSASDQYRERLENVSSEEKQLRHTGTLADAEQQKITSFDRLTDADVDAGCRRKPAPTSAVADAAQREPGYQQWLNAVRGFQQLNRDGRYRIVFFLNVAPLQCPETTDVFVDDGPAGLNALFLRVIGDGLPVVSAHGALLHTRPRQMPGWNGHSFGNTNVVKAEALFGFLRDRVLPEALTPRRQTSAAGR